MLEQEEAQVVEDMVRTTIILNTINREILMTTIGLDPSTMVLINNSTIQLLSSIRAKGTISYTIRIQEAHKPIKIPTVAKCRMCSIR